MAGGWDAYITNLLDSSSCIKKAAIISATDGGIWARSGGATKGAEFKASADEFAKFARLYDNLNDVPSTGFTLEGKKYIVPRTDDNLIFGKKDKTGIFAVKTAMAVLIAYYEGEASDGQECRTAVEKLAGFLGQSGY